MYTYIYNRSPLIYVAGNNILMISDTYLLPKKKERKKKKTKTTNKKTTKNKINKQTNKKTLIYLTYILYKVLNRLTVIFNIYSLSGINST